MHLDLSDESLSWIPKTEIIDFSISKLYSLEQKSLTNNTRHHSNCTVHIHYVMVLHLSDILIISVIKKSVRLENIFITI